MNYEQFTDCVFYWDPKPEIFTIPFLHWPILWYGLLFACGFILGFPIFVGVILRFFLQNPAFEEREIIGELRHPKFDGVSQRNKSSVAKILNQWISSSDDPIEDPLPKKIASQAQTSPFPQQALRRLKLDRMFSHAVLSLHKQAVFITDRLVVYMVLATVIGARVGHFLFYERPSDYLSDPIQLLQIWKGGLASHGAAIAIVIALVLFAHKYRDRSKGLSWLHLLDFVSIPTALAGAFIRVGNFFNQEILGTMTNRPWAVVFGHPADHSSQVPRHPVQLYEALFYAIVFGILWRLSFRPKYLLAKGKLIGLFLVLVFGFRFAIEVLKEEQSHIMPLGFDLTMGQILSIPAILVGLFLVFRRL